MRRQALGEVGLWLFAVLLAFVWGLFVTPGTGRKLLTPAPEPARLICTEWEQIDAIQVPTGNTMTVSRFCKKFGEAGNE